MGKIKLGCLNTLYKSVQDLSLECLLSWRTKEMLIPSQEETQSYHDDLIPSNEPYKFFICSKLDKRTCPRLLNPSADYSCFGCRSRMSREVEAKHVRKQSVIAGCNFVITDDLDVFPHTKAFSAHEWLYERGITNTKTPSLVIETVSINTEKVFMILVVLLSNLNCRRGIGLLGSFNN